MWITQNRTSLAVRRAAVNDVYDDRDEVDADALYSLADTRRAEAGSPLAAERQLYVAMFPMSQGNRQLTDHERRLVRWMLEHGSLGAAAFLPQLDEAEVTPWKCGCGCASINVQLRGRPQAPPGVHIVADFVFGERDTLSGIFVYEKDGILSGLEVCGYAGEAPKSLPQPEELRPLGD